MQLDWSPHEGMSTQRAWISEPCGSDKAYFISLNHDGTYAVDCVDLYCRYHPVDGSPATTLAAAQAAAQSHWDSIWHA